MNRNFESIDTADRFSLVVGGPFHAILRRLGLTDADGLPTGRAAVGLALLAWLPPALLAVAQALLGGQSAGWEFFADWTIYARFLVAVWVLISTERHSDGRIVILTRQFRGAGCHRGRRSAAGGGGHPDPAGRSRQVDRRHDTVGGEREEGQGEVAGGKWRVEYDQSLIL